MNRKDPGIGTKSRIGFLVGFFTWIILSLSYHQCCGIAYLMNRTSQEMPKIHLNFCFLASFSLEPSSAITHRLPYQHLALISAPSLCCRYRKERRIQPGAAWYNSEQKPNSRKTWFRTKPQIRKSRMTWFRAKTQIPNIQTTWFRAKIRIYLIAEWRDS